MITDVFETARQRISAGLIEKYFRVEKAYWEKGEYFTLSPLRHDRNIGSFHIHESGVFIDHATDDGGDFIDLVSRVYGLDSLDTARKIIEDSGGSIDLYESDKQQIKKEKKKTDALYPIVEYNKSELLKFLNSDYVLTTHGKYIEGYKYYNEDGKLVFFTARFEKETNGEIKKKVLPIHLKKNNSFGIGRVHELEPYPLYMGYKIFDNDNTVVIVEGEKCANVKVEGYNLVTWMGGTSNVHLANWKILKNRRVIIWPDADEPGLKAGIYIKSIIKDAELIDVSDCPDKWDIADARKEDIDLIYFIECHERIKEPEPIKEPEKIKVKEVKEKEKPSDDLTPYDVFKRYIFETYDNENLEHVDSTFWEYCVDKHLWKIEQKENIKTDIAKWIEDKGIINELKNAEKVIHTFKKNTANEIDLYTQSRKREENPFLNSAIRPYIFYKNGAVKVESYGKEFYDRKDHGECFFKNLFPIHCLDFEFTEEIYTNNNIKQSAPCFYYYATELIPDNFRDIESEKEKTIQMFSQILAYSIIPIKKTEYVFGFYGKQNAGKSFFIDILREFIGGESIVSRPVSQMESSFSSSQLWGSKVYVDDDFKANIKLPDDFIKKYAGNKITTIEFKNQKPVHNVQLSIAMFFLSNHNFKVTSSPEGMERRLIYVPFKRSIPLDELDRTMLDKITGKYPKGKESGEYTGKTFDERPGMLALALSGFDLFMENNFNFIVPEWVRLEKEKWVQESNTVNEFLYDEYFSQNKETRTKGKDLHNLYKKWCEEEDRKPLGKNNFLDECMKNKNIKDYNNGKERYIFINKIKSDQQVEDEQIPI